MPEVGPEVRLDTPVPNLGCAFFHRCPGVGDEVVQKLAAGDLTGLMVQFTAKLFAEKLIPEFPGLVETVAPGRNLPRLAVFEHWT